MDFSRRLASVVRDGSAGAGGRNFSRAALATESALGWDERAASRRRRLQRAVGRAVDAQAHVEGKSRAGTPRAARVDPRNPLHIAIEQRVGDGGFDRTLA